MNTNNNKLPLYAILSLIGIILIGTLAVFAMIFLAQAKKVPMNIVSENNTFTLESVKLNKKINNTEESLPNLQSTSNRLDFTNFNDENDYVERNDDAGNKGEVITTEEGRKIKGSNSTYKLNGNSGFFDKTILLKDGKEIWSKELIFTSFDPVRSFFVLDDNVVLAYDHYNGTVNEKDVIINGISMNEKYSLSSSFAAFPINNSITFFAQKGERYYFIINESFYELPDSMKEIIDPACCEPAAYQVSAYINELIFYSVGKDGFWYQNKITLK